MFELLNAKEVDLRIKGTGQEVLSSGTYFESKARNATQLRLND